MNSTVDPRTVSEYDKREFSRLTGRTGTMIREVAIFKFKSSAIAEAVQVLEQYAAFKRTRPGCRTAGVNPMVHDPALPYLDSHAVLVYAEYDDLKCLAETSHALQEHFHLHRLPLQDFTVGPPVYGIFEA